MQKAIAMLSEVKESIINAYEIKTGQSRAKLSHLMDAETWMNANKAIELGFADDVLTDEKKVVDDFTAFSFSRKAVTNSLLNKLTRKRACVEPAPPEKPEETGRSVDALYERLNILKHY
jgi:ATP-dependent Clp protease protease subunit